MIPVMQSTATNCFAACVATLLEIPIEQVPTACDGMTWDWEAFQQWLNRQYDAQCLEILLDYEQSRLYPVFAGIECILTGESPRDCLSGQHAVVGRFVGLEGFEVLHDPHNSGAGIVGDPTFATFFVPRLSRNIKDRRLINTFKGVPGYEGLL